MHERHRRNEAQVKHLLYLGRWAGPRLYESREVADLGGSHFSSLEILGNAKANERCVSFRARITPELLLFSCNLIRRAFFSWLVSLLRSAILQ